MGDHERPDWSGRLRRIWRSSSPSPSLVVTTPANIKYLTGFGGSAGLLVATPDRIFLLIDGRYYQGAVEALRSGRLAEVEIVLAQGSLDETLSDVLGRVAGPVGFEAEHVTVASLERWRARFPNREFVPTTKWIEEQRAIKDSFELEVIRKACRRLSDVARELARWVGEGRTEREVAAEIDAAMDRAGFSGPAFETIVASGPNSSLPHARPTDRRLAEGDLVVLDFGGVLDGYCGDLTRMAGVGQVGTEARALFEAVRAAQVAALAAVRAEALVFEVDTAARRVLTAHGFGDAFLHATGHGLGLEVHEAPRLGRARDSQPERLDRLAPGMVCTIEPGAYVQGVGGVRLEDDVVVTADGCEVLTDAPRDLLLV